MILKKIEIYCSLYWSIFYKNFKFITCQIVDRWRTICMLHNTVARWHWWQQNIIRRNRHAMTNVHIRSSDIYLRIYTYYCVLFYWLHRLNNHLSFSSILYTIREHLFVLFFIVILIFIIIYFIFRCVINNKIMHQRFDKPSFYSFSIILYILYYIHYILYM